MEAYLLKSKGRGGAEVVSVVHQGGDTGWDGVSACVWVEGRGWRKEGKGHCFWWELGLGLKQSRVSTAAIS